MSRESRSGGPVIGVTVEVLQPPHYDGRRRYQLFTDYLECLRAVGATGILLPADAGEEEALAWLDLVDGLLLTGGDDPDLRPLGGPAPLPVCTPIPEAKLALDLALVERACQDGLPLFGVCLGMQELGLAHRAPFIQHIEAEPGHQKGAGHTVRPEAGSLLARLVGEAPVAVSCFHHQALAAPGDGLAAAAWAEDGTLEAVERPDRAFVLGVQWHPERMPESAASKALFSGFVAAARRYRDAGR